MVGQETHAAPCAVWKEEVGYSGDDVTKRSPFHEASADQKRAIELNIVCG
jgi:hypothetical protein